jgi:hypothetical protein
MASLFLALCLRIIILPLQASMKIRRSIKVAFAVGLLTAIVGIATFRNMSSPTVQGLSPKAARNIRAALSRDGWRSVGLQLRRFDFRSAGVRLRELAGRRIRVIRLEQEDTAVVDADDCWTSCRQYQYRLERITNDWAVLGYRYSD